MLLVCTCTYTLKPSETVATAASKSGFHSVVIKSLNPFLCFLHVIVLHMYTISRKVLQYFADVILTSLKVPFSRPEN